MFLLRVFRIIQFPFKSNFIIRKWMKSTYLIRIFWSNALLELIFIIWMKGSFMNGIYSETFSIY